MDPIESLGYSCRKREVRKRYGFSIAVKVVGAFIPSDEVSRAFYDIGGITYRANPTIPKNEASQEQKTAPKKSQPNQKKDNLFLLFQRSILFDVLVHSHGDFVGEPLEPAYPHSDSHWCNPAISVSWKPRTLP